MNNKKNIKSITIQFNMDKESDVDLYNKIKEYAYKNDVGKSFIVKNYLLNTMLNE